MAPSTKSSCTDCYSSTCHPKRPSQAQSALLDVNLFQVHSAHSHYLTDQINLFSAQVLVPQVLIDKNKERRTEIKERKRRCIVGNNKRHGDENIEKSGGGEQKVGGEQSEREH